MIPFVELKSQFRAIEPEVRAAIDRVLARAWYILGEEGAAFESAFASWLGVSHAAGVASGTDALALALRAVGINAGDEVIAPANTCVPTITGICLAGARPVLADVDDATLTLDPTSVVRALTPRTRAIVPVHLYGHPCNMEPLLQIARDRKLFVVEDCAQAHGAMYRRDLCGTFGDAAAFSFYPSKNLGAFGDAGAVVSNNPAVIDRVRQLRNYGQADRYHHVVEGMNSRLDELQAAILRAKLPYLGEWNHARGVRAEHYGSRLSGVRIPVEESWAVSSWHLYPIRTPRRDELRAHLRGKKIGTEIHYPVPVHLQPAYAHLGYSRGAFPIAEQACNEVLSLPLYPELPLFDVDCVATAIRDFFG